MTLAIESVESGSWSRGVRRLFASNRVWLPVLPAFTYFLIFFIIPAVSLFFISLNKPTLGTVGVQRQFALKNFTRFFGRSLYHEAAIRSASSPCWDGCAR